MNCTRKNDYISDFRYQKIDKYETVYLQQFNAGVKTRNATGGYETINH